MEIIIVAAIVIIGWLLYKKVGPGKNVKTITSEEAKAKFNDRNVQFIDVRTKGEYKGQKVKQFKNMPLHELGNRAKELDPNKEVIVLCQSGMRSGKACSELKRQGFTNVSNVRGGLNMWR
ncbi:rhodanese-like domain-containing protein [Pseudalkalibacillus hwajinpoensis]|uniref:Rhodanese-like domain-containing protein n=1 Tax=Guptibacillus hwajinpoensis TaxID=208199 RepID=A0A4U1M6R2_9BACL|nr:rhodanese-like domain-containing protein [Pseudalkalibacillus hwajinpoensis]TKD66429.1 rhodanese-like domain-containing protein [Pseudalkalibacillus hwajinpoensis]